MSPPKDKKQHIYSDLWNSEKYIVMATTSALIRMLSINSLRVRINWSGFAHVKSS